MVFRIFFACIGVLCILLLGTDFFLTHLFGTLSVDQIFFHLFFNFTEGADKNLLHKVYLYLAIPVLLSVAYIFILFRTPKCIKDFFVKIGKRGRGLVAVFLSSIFLLSFFYLYSKYSISSYIAHTDGDFIERFYKVPRKETIRFTKKKNIVIVLLESFENSFYDPLLGRSYMPYLERMQKKSLYTTNMQNLDGSRWTIAAVTGWFFGLPLKVPSAFAENGYITDAGFLPNALSIFDILHEHGYITRFVLGSDRHFSGKDILFGRHGNFTIHDRLYFESQGWKLADYQGSYWGYTDSFTFDRAFEEYVELRKQDRPFVLFVESVDTHMPDGYCVAEKRVFNDLRDSIVESDLVLGRFIDRIRSFEKGVYEETVYVFLGDHLFMGTPDFLKDIRNRRIYNAFYGALPAERLPDGKESMNLTALDIAPTLLHLAGAEFENYQFGLGYSLFSSNPSLSHVLGNDRLNHYCNQPSAFYKKFY